MIILLSFLNAFFPPLFSFSPSVINVTPKNTGAYGLSLGNVYVFHINGTKIAHNIFAFSNSHIGIIEVLQYENYFIH